VDMMRNVYQISTCVDRTEATIVGTQWPCTSWPGTRLRYHCNTALWASVTSM